MANVLDDLGRKGVIGKKAFRFGSYGWSGGAQKELDEIMSRWRLDWEFLPPCEFKGRPQQEAFDAIYERGAQLARQIKRESQPVEPANHLQKETELMAAA